MDPAFKVWLVHLLNVLIGGCDVLTDLLLGWTFSRGSRRERELARRDPGRSARLVSVACSAAYAPEFPSAGTNAFFVLRHLRYVDPRVVLRDDRICLSHVTRDEAFFAVPRGVGEDPYDTARAPFHPQAAFRMSDQLVVVPTSTFHRLAEECGDPTRPLGIAAMTLRCGSTLLSQVMNRVPNTRSISEPTALVTLYALYYWRTIDADDLRLRLRSAVRLLARTGPGSTTERVVIKLTQFSCPFLGELARLFPEARLIRSTRMPAASIASYRRILELFDSRLYGRLGVNWKNWLCPALSLALERVLGEGEGAAPALSPWRRDISTYEVAALSYGASLACTKLHEDAFAATILYEDLSARPEAAVRTLLEALGVDPAHLPGALEALGRDSQAGMFRRFKGQGWTPEERRRCGEWFARLKLPISVDCTEEEFRAYLKI